MHQLMNSLYDAADDGESVFATLRHVELECSFRSSRGTAAYSTFSFETSSFESET